MGPRLSSNATRRAECCVAAAVLLFPEPRVPALAVTVRTCLCEADVCTLRVQRRKHPIYARHPSAEISVVRRWDDRVLFHHEFATAWRTSYWCAHPRTRSPPLCGVICGSATLMGDCLAMGSRVCQTQARPHPALTYLALATRVGKQAQLPGERGACRGSVDSKRGARSTWRACAARRTVSLGNLRKWAVYQTF